MHECDLCGKSFQSDCHLKRHKNRQRPCNAIKESTECKLCNQKFTWPADLIRHLNTSKHKKNYNIQINNNITNNITNNNIHVTIMRGFSETNINVITEEDIYNLLIKETDLYRFIKDSKEEKAEDLNYDANFVISIFNFLIKIFSKLNFNLAYSENHNCLIFSLQSLIRNL
jgi:hypothetical protein